MRLLLLADVHLDAPFAWAPGAVARQRRQHLRDALDAAVTRARELEVDAVCCAGDLYAGSRASAADNFGLVFLWKFMWINTVLLAFTLFVPCFPLDGGRVFADALLLRGLSADAAATWVVRVSVPIIVGLIAYGVYALADGGPMTFLTLFTTVWLVRQTFDLHSAIGQGVIHQHPLFAHAQGVPARPVQPAVAPVGGGSGGTHTAVTGERV